MSHLRRHHWLIVPLAALALVALGVGAATVDGDAVEDARSPGAAAGDPLHDAPPAGLGTGRALATTAETDRRIAFWQGRLAQTPTSDQAYTYLGDLFAQKGRETGDMAWYARADQAYRRAVELYPGNLPARAGLARNLVTLHRFREAVAEGTRILSLDPTARGAVAIVGDASLELGDLDTARAAFETLGRVQGGPAVDIRSARLAFLEGRTDDAIRLAEQASETASALNASAEEVAFSLYAAGEYRFSHGDVDGAERAYRAALDAFPGYHLAVAALGRVAFARGDLDDAVTWLRSAVAIAPRIETLAYLGDLYALRDGPGDVAAAEAEYAAAEFLGNLAAQADGLGSARELALFLASHGRQPERALALAAAELVERTDVYGFDAHAWALHANGRSGDALEHARRALALGTRDARLLFHLGMIQVAAGDTVSGRRSLEDALALNPAFDPLGARLAREALGR